MNAETDKFYGRDAMSRTFKWGVLVPSPTGMAVIAWFVTRKRAEGWAAERRLYTFGIARLERVAGVPV